MAVTVDEADTTEAGIVGGVVIAEEAVTAEEVVIVGEAEVAEVVEGE